MNRTILAPAAALALAVISSGCMSMMLAGAPTARSFEDPPVREVVDPYPREALFGRWESTGRMDQFIDGKRVMVLDTASELVLNEDGTCVDSTTMTLVEQRMAGGFGFGYSPQREYQESADGTWSYENGILTLELEGMEPYAVTLHWHSDEEFSVTETDEQVKANARATGFGNNWDEVAKEPNGVLTRTKKGIPFVQPEQKSVQYASPYKRAGDAD